MKQEYIVSLGIVDKFSPISDWDDGIRSRIEFAKGLTRIDHLPDEEGKRVVSLLQILEDVYKSDDQEERMLIGSSGQQAAAAGGYSVPQDVCGNTAPKSDAPAGHRQGGAAPPVGIPQRANRGNAPEVDFGFMSANRNSEEESWLRVAGNPVKTMDLSTRRCARSSI